MKINEKLKEAAVENESVKTTKKQSVKKKSSTKKSVAKKTSVKKSVAKKTSVKKSVGKKKGAKKTTFEVKKVVKTSKKGDVKTALLKKAMGYDASEITEEYSVGENGEVTLSKRKVIKKNVPPDVAAIKYLLECEGSGVKSVDKMTEEELLAEKEKLLKELADEKINQAES